VCPKEDKSGSFAAEESKVKLKERVSSLGEPQKKGASRVAHFAFGFQRTSPSSVQSLLARLVPFLGIGNRCFSGFLISRFDPGLRKIEKNGAQLKLGFQEV